MQIYFLTLQKVLHVLDGRTALALITADFGIETQEILVLQFINFCQHMLTFGFVKNSKTRLNSLSG